MCKIYGWRGIFITIIFGFKRILRVCVLYLCLVILLSLASFFIKFDAGAIFGFAAPNIAAIFGVLAPYATYKDYEFMKIRSESSLF